MKRSAYISECGRYRYSLEREWGEGPACAFVMLNPSTADAERDDPTIRRCIGFARLWGFGTLIVVNAFALRATNPAELYTDPDPIGGANDDWIVHTAGRCDLIVAAWGTHGAFRRRGDEVRALLAASKRQLHHLGLTEAGHPRHPLYLRGDTKPELWR